jgi:hypothetical protein|tara:strand:- start:12701 stop:13477 length:777 start_codon:yes stop_codon:yes gene_type:complete
MSNCYKNFPVIVNYSNSTTDTIYSNSASLSENLNIEHAKSLGIKGSNAVFIKTLTQGELSVDSYLFDDLGIFHNLKGLNDQEITLQFGPYSCPAPCVLSSMSVNISVEEPITVSRSFNYFGGVTGTTSPTPTNPTLSPVIPENIVLNGFDNLGALDNITSITWTFSQSYQEYYLLGESVPKIAFTDGQITMNIDGEGIADPLITENCISEPNDYEIEVYGCGGDNLGSLSITGHLQARTSSVASDDDEQNSVSIIQYL